MAGGSETPENRETENQCIHCGLWWGAPGLRPHEEHCDMAAYDTRLVPLTDPYALWRADDVDFETAVADADRDGDADALADLDDGAVTGDLDAGTGPEPTPVSSAGADPGGDPPPDPTTARADGGPLSVPEFGGGDGDQDLDGDAGAGDALDDDPGDDQDLTCGSCDGSNVEDPADCLPQEALDDRPEVTEFDGVCIDCSTDDDGEWQSPIEVVTGE